MFTQLHLKSEYRSLKDDLVNDFFVPLLERAVRYDRAVGFFSSTALLRVSIGLAGLVHNEGRMRLVVSPYLQDEDREAIRRGYEARATVVERALLRRWEEPQNEWDAARLGLLAYLVAIERLDVKVAFTARDETVGMYHEKLGIMVDRLGNAVAFTGSLNESEMAFHWNYETIDVFCSWTADRERVAQKQAAFERLWTNVEPGVAVMDFPEAARKKLLAYQREPVDWTVDARQYPRRQAEVVPRDSLPVPRLPEGVILHDYQQHAIAAWEQAGFRGIFDMATGTGKTYTALAGICRLYAVHGPPLAVVIVCPYQHLVHQWAEEARHFNLRPLEAYSAAPHRQWRQRFRDAITAINQRGLKHLTVITTSATFATSQMATQLAALRVPTLLVADEAHNLGAPLRQRYLPDWVPYRLALSATVDRHRDPEGTARLFEYFGERCLVYPLEQAIQEGHLTPYEYHPIVVYLDDDELAEYRALTRQLAKYGHPEVHEEPSEGAKRILLRRARLVATARQKVERLVEFMEPFRQSCHLLVYCGAGLIGPSDAKEARQIDMVVRQLGNELGMKVAKFTAQESREERERLLAAFGAGDLQALVAIRCLDEGVNIPAIRTAWILASSTNPKEYVQRRGRVLRLAPGKRRAGIYDFVTLPRPLEEVVHQPVEVTRYDIGLVRREWERMKEFAALAENPHEAGRILDQMAETYHLYQQEGWWG